jgi:hypothetical protein
VTDLVSWLITAVVVVVLAAFVLYVAGLQALPTARRPRTRKFDRFGRCIGLTENPDYHENPGEDAPSGPDVLPRRTSRLHSATRPEEGEAE